MANKLVKQWHAFEEKMEGFLNIFKHFTNTKVDGNKRNNGIFLLLPGISDIQLIFFFNFNLVKQCCFNRVKTIVDECKTMFTLGEFLQRKNVYFLKHLENQVVDG